MKQTSLNLASKKGHSTGQCTNVLKIVVDYHTTRGSHVFTCFVDFRKAFDRVNYWKLFNKLLDDNAPDDVLALHAFVLVFSSACRLT